MQAQKKVPPKPQGQRKKEQRNSKIQATLKQQRQARRNQNKQKRAAILKKAQQHEANYQQQRRTEIDARRQAKLSGQIYVPAAPKVAFVFRIRGINQLNPQVTRILRLIRLRQIHNGAFIRVNKATINMLRRVQPYITYGFPTRESIRKIIYKRGYGKVNRQRIPLTNNSIVEGVLGKYNITCVEDLINQIYTCGPHFKQANNFLWPFKLRAPRGGYSHKRHPYQRGGDWGNRQLAINTLISRAI